MTLSEPFDARIYGRLLLEGKPERVARAMAKAVAARVAAQNPERPAAPPSAESPKASESRPRRAVDGGHVTEACWTFGRRLRRLRRDRGMSQQELAARAGVSRPTISEAECGKHGLQFQTLIRVAESLNADYNDLLGGLTVPAEKTVRKPPPPAPKRLEPVQPTRPVIRDDWQQQHPPQRFPARDRLHDGFGRRG